MDEDDIDGWRRDWQDAVRHREARSDLLLALSSRPMVTKRRIAWTDKRQRETLALPEQATVRVAPLPYSRLGRVWIDGVRMPGDIDLQANFREPTAQELGSGGAPDGL